MKHGNSISAKRLILFFILLLFYFNGSSQTKDSTLDFSGFIGLMVGSGIPQGSYGSSSGGYAKTGLQLKLDIGIPVYKAFGAVLSIHGGHNTFDNMSYAEQYGGPIYAQASASSWSYYGGALGAYLKSPMRQFPLFAKMQYGYYQFTSPQKDVIAHSSGGPSYTISYSESQKTVWAPAFIFGAGMIIKLPVGSAFLFGFDYLKSSPTFNNVSSSIYSSPKTVIPNGTKDITVKQDIDIMTLYIGVAFPF